MILLALLALFSHFAFQIYRYLFPPPNIRPEGKYILITGCDTGFGHGLAIELDQQGFHVFAGVFTEKGERELSKILSANATVFHLDVTQERDIDLAYALVKGKTNSLHALVNNAGISTSGYIDWMTMDSIRKIMEVNFFGQVAITKKFLPLLISKRDSRVVNLCSVAGIVSAPMKSAYSASKYALESFSDCLRREMVPWGLRVSIIEPGPMRTPIITGHDQFMQQFWNNLPNDVQERWGEDFLQVQARMLSQNFLYRRAEDPQKVVRALQHAVSNSKPETRYRPGWQSKFIFLPISVLPTWLADKIMSGTINAGLLPADLRKQHRE